MWEKIFFSGLPEIYEYKRPAEVLSRAYERPLSWEHNPAPLGPDRLDRSNSFPRFHVFLGSVPIGSERGFPAKRQEFKVEWATFDTEPDWIHRPFICAEESANGHSPGCVPANGADKDHSKYSLCFHVCNGEKQGKRLRSKRIRLYPSVLVTVRALSLDAIFELQSVCSRLYELILL